MVFCLYMHCTQPCLLLVNGFLDDALPNSGRLSKPLIQLIGFFCSFQQICSVSWIWGWPRNKQVLNRRVTDVSEFDVANFRAGDEKVTGHSIVRVYSKQNILSAVDVACKRRAWRFSYYWATTDRIVAAYTMSLGANYKKILRLSYDVIITYDNRKSNLRFFFVISPPFRNSNNSSTGTKKILVLNG